MPGILTLDLGTTSLKATLFDQDARTLHLEQRASAPDYHGDGRVEQDPEFWPSHVPGMLRGCAEAAQALGVKPACLAVTAQRSSLIAVDREDRPLHPAIMWQDGRTRALAEQLAQADPWVYRRTGLRVSPVFSAVKMTWLRRHRPEVWSRTARLLGVQDWVLHLLTGRYLTDHTFASRTNLFDLERRQWDPELLALFEVDADKLCGLMAPGDAAGGLTPAMAEATGLPAGLPVVSAGGDQQCAALGLGLFSHDTVVANTGTGSYLIGHAGKPVLDPNMGLACNVSAVPGAWIVEAAVLTTGTLYRWLAELLQGGGTDFEAVGREAAQSPAGAHGLLFLPHFQGCGAPHWDAQARGAWFNLSLGTGRADLARSVLEGIALAMKDGLELVEDACGRAAAVSVAGGLTRSALFNRIQSDAFGRTVVRFQDDEATSRGAWIAGMVAAGLAEDHAAAFRRANPAGAAATWDPDPATRELYRRQRRQAQGLYQALAAPAFRELFR